MFIVKLLAFLSLLLSITFCLGNEDYTKCTREEKDLLKIGIINPDGVNEQANTNVKNYSLLMLYYCDQLDKDKK